MGCLEAFGAVRLLEALKFGTCSGSLKKRFVAVSIYVGQSCSFRHTHGQLWLHNSDPSVLHFWPAPTAYTLRRHYNQLHFSNQADLRCKIFAPVICYPFAERLAWKERQIWLSRTR